MLEPGGGGRLPEVRKPPAFNKKKPKTENPERRRP